MTNDKKALNAVFDLIEKRKKEMPEGSYTTYLFNSGIDKICKKIGEEATEVVIAAKDADNAQVQYESADLLYHLLVLLSFLDMRPEQIEEELLSRYEKKDK